VIEAKIDAQEGDSQLEDYDEWIEKELGHQGNVWRVFLTPDGRPAETSTIWPPLSFLELACILRAELPQLQDRPGYHFLRYYLTGVLKDVYRWNLPVHDPAHAVDAYGFLHYLRSIRARFSKGAHA
jgi:hypothetical protein